MKNSHSAQAPNLTHIVARDMEQAPKARREVDAPEKARFWIKRRAERLESRSSIQRSLARSSQVDPGISSMKMTVAMGILVCFMIVSMGLTTYAIAFESPLEKESNDMESTIKSRSDYPDYDDLSSFFDFEIGPPSITYKDAAQENEKTTLRIRPNGNKNYYYYHSDGRPKYGDPHYPSTPKQKVVTPGTHYKSSTEKTFIEDDTKLNESKSVLNQAKIGSYQVSVVDADSPILSNLGLTQEDLARLSGYNKRSVTNASMFASDSTPTATYAENPRPNYSQSGFSPSNSQNAPSYQPSYDTSKYPPPPSSDYTERQYRPNDHYPQPSAPHVHNDYNHASAQGPSHPPPQGSYDAKSYRDVQNGHHHGSNSHNYPPPSHHHYPPSNTAYNNPPPPAYSYNNPPPSTSYNNQPLPSPTYNPQRSSSTPWRQSPQVHTDWDDKSKKHESWQNGPYPPHPPPLPYSSTSSSTGSYHPKPSYGSTSEKTGHRYAASYSKPEASSKPSYSSSSNSEYNSHKPYYSSSSYSPSSKAPSRDGSESYAASSHHHHPAPSKPGITIRFKAKSPGHGVSIPLNFSPLEVVKKLLPLSSLNPLNNKKVTIGITIENKKDHQTEYHSY